jgi:hypothetical protein
MARSLCHAAVVVALLGASAHAGEIKIHEWPTVFIPQEVATIPVVMDVGYYILVKDQDKLRIKLQQKSIHTYEGCIDVVVSANFNMTFSCTIAATGAVPGKYSCSVLPANVDEPGGTTTGLCHIDRRQFAGGARRRERRARGHGDAQGGSAVTRDWGWTGRMGPATMGA